MTREPIAFFDGIAINGASAKKHDSIAKTIIDELVIETTARSCVLLLRPFSAIPRPRVAKGRKVFIVTAKEKYALTQSIKSHCVPPSRRGSRICDLCPTFAIPFPCVTGDRERRSATK